MKKGSEDLDLTPFIGLFAMLVVLLLMTASWSKLYSFKTKFSKSMNTLSSEQPKPQNKKKKKEVTLKIQIYSNAILFIEEGAKTIRSKMKMNSSLSKRQLSQKIKKWALKYGAEKQITIETISKLEYGSLIQIYDVVFGAGMETIAISTDNLSRNNKEG